MVTENSFRMFNTYFGKLDNQNDYKKQYSALKTEKN